jgi:hypothetical protein
MRRLCEIADIRAETLYHRIGRIYDQCRIVALAHERHLLSDGFGHSFLHLCTDRQDYTLNWGSSLERTPTILRATTTAESRTGYVLAQHLNVDPDVDLQECELAAREIGDPKLPLAYRRYARLCLHQWQERVEAAVRPVAGGVQVHDTCSIFAHFSFIEELVKHVPEIQFSLDGDPGIDRACLTAFGKRIMCGDTNVVVLRINKEMTVAQRRTALSKASELLENLRDSRPNMKDSEIIADVLATRYRYAKGEQPKPFNR